LTSSRDRVEKLFFVCIIVFVVLSFVLAGLLIANVFKSNSIDLRMVSGSMSTPSPSVLSQATSVSATLWALALALSIASYLCLRVITHRIAFEQQAQDDKVAIRAG